MEKHVCKVLLPASIVFGKMYVYKAESCLQVSLLILNPALQATCSLVIITNLNYYLDIITE